MRDQKRNSPRGAGSIASIALPEHPVDYCGPEALAARVQDDRLIVVLKDGRELRVPIEMLPGVASAVRKAREKVELVGGGIGVRFPRCDEDFSIESLLSPERFRTRRR